MPPLGRTLQDYDLGHLRVIAEFWGLEMPPGRSAEAAEALAGKILQSEDVSEIVESLPEASRGAFEWLLAQGGRAPLTDLQLRFGPLSRAGAGRRDREKPWRDRQAALDGLLYRGLIGLAFYETPAGPREFAFVPDELLARVGPRPSERHGGRSVPSPAIVLPAGGAADDAVTLLAALRRRPARSDSIAADRAAGLQPYLIHPGSVDLLVALLRGLGVLLEGPLRPAPERVRALLRAGKVPIEQELREAWLESPNYNDLSYVSGLMTAGQRWPNDPLVSRLGLVRLMESWSRGTWQDLESVVSMVRDQHPTFLRGGGEAESWYLKETSSGRFLRGLEDWEAVEGGYLRFCLTGPLHWLGVIDLGSEPDDRRPTRIRLRKTPTDRSRSVDVAGHIEPPKARLTPDGRIFFPRESSLPDRYQVARFAEWIRLDGSGTVYRLTPRALATAASQRLETKGVIKILESATGREIPEPLRRSLDRWARRGAEAGLEDAVVLRVKDAAVLRELQRDPMTSRYLAEILSPSVARVQRRDVDKLISAAARRGLLVDPPEAGSESP